MYVTVGLLLSKDGGVFLPKVCGEGSGMWIHIGEQPSNSGV